MGQLYTSSRWTRGNRIFPDTLSVEPDGIHYHKRRLLGSEEEIISYRQISSIRTQNGIMFSTIVIETSGGSQPVSINGLYKSDAKAIKESIQSMQQQSTR
jgi:hypothetical protein